MTSLDVLLDAKLTAEGAIFASWGSFWKHQEAFWRSKRIIDLSFCYPKWSLYLLNSTLRTPKWHLKTHLSHPEDHFWQHQEAFWRRKRPIKLQEWRPEDQIWQLRQHFDIVFGTFKNNPWSLGSQDPPPPIHPRCLERCAPWLSLQNALPRSLQKKHIWLPFMSLDVLSDAKRMHFGGQNDA